MARPVISHEPPSSVVSGQPLRMVARVKSTGELTEVAMHLAQSGGAAPVKLVMRPAGAGVYSVRVDPRYFSGADSFRYYIDARMGNGMWTETNWNKVSVIGQVQAPGSEEQAWVRPTIIGAGAALAVGAGVALADSGGGGGGGSDNDNAGDGGGADPADQVIVRSLSDDVDAANPGLPKTSVVDVSDELGGRTINRVRIRLNFDASDGGEEEVELIYNGSTVLSKTVNGTDTDQVDVLGSTDSRVQIRVVNSVPDEGTSTYRWTVTVTYFVD
jgi:hypothetical protein